MPQVNSTNLSILLTVNNDNKTYTLTDNYDYASDDFNILGVSGVEGNAKVVSPAGDTILDGLTTPDWDSPLITAAATPSAAQSLSGSLDDLGGGILQGDYVVTYRMRWELEGTQILVNNAVVVTDNNPGDLNTTIIPVGTTIELEGWDTAGNNISAVVAGVTPGAGFTSISVDGTPFTTETPTGSPKVYVVFEREFTLCFDFEKTDIDFSVTHSCPTTKLSYEDQTVYPSSETVVSRAWVIKSPTLKDGSNVVPDVNDTAISGSINPIYTGTYNVSLNVTLQETLTSGIVVDYTAGGTQSHVVDCNRSIANALDCLHQIITTILEKCGCSKLSPKDQCVLNELNGYFMLLMVADGAGNDAKIKQYTDEIYEIADEYGCSCDPADSENNPVLVTNSFTTLLASAADISVVTDNASYSNVQQFITYFEGLPTTGGIVDYGRLTEVTHPAEWPGYDHDVDLDFCVSGDALEILIDFDSSDASGALGVKIDDADIGLICLVGANTGQARVVVTQKNNVTLRSTIISEPNGNIVSADLPSQDLTVSKNIKVYWVTQGGTGNIRAPRVTRIKGANVV